jgi:hypothetical protein
MTYETWLRLRRGEPESCELLLEKLMEIARHSSRSERTVSRQPAAAFAWCRGRCRQLLLACQAH